MNLDLSTSRTALPPGLPVRESLPSHEGAVVDVSGDGGVVKTIEQPGGGELPHVDDEVVILFRVRLEDGTEIESSDDFGEEGLAFTLDTAAVVLGLELAVLTMRTGERARVTVLPHYGYRPQFRPARVPEDAPLHVDVQLLLARPRSKLISDMTEEEKVEAAVREREAGNGMFREGKLKEAALKYQSALSHLDQLQDTAPAEVARRGADIFVPCLLNLALCCLRLGELDVAVDACNRVLMLEPENAKALYRRGKALAEKGELARSRGDLEHARRLAPSDQDVARELRLLRQRETEQLRREQRMYQAMLQPDAAQAQRVLRRPGGGGGGGGGAAAQAVAPGTAAASSLLYAPLGWLHSACHLMWRTPVHATWTAVTCALNPLWWARLYYKLATALLHRTPIVGGLLRTNRGR